MSVHYKFKSALEYDTITFDGLHISVKDLKNAIIQQKRIGKSTDFDLQVTNAQTKEVYSDENVLIPKNTSLLIARIPNANQSKSRQWEGYGGDSSPTVKLDDGGPIAKAADLSSLDAPEDDKIKAMMSQSTQDYDPSNYQKIRGANQMGTVPPTYRCYKCHQTGHWIKDCTFSQGGESIEIKKSTGIPQSFMVPVEGPQVPGAMMTPNGSYAVPALDHEAYNSKSTPAPMAPEPKPDIPEDLICSICLDLLADAVMIPCCGNSFCDECIRFTLLESEEHECPDCHEKDISPGTLIPNRFLRKSVANFKNTTGYVKKPIFRPPPREIPVKVPEPNKNQTENITEKPVISEADSTEQSKIQSTTEKNDEATDAVSKPQSDSEIFKDGPPGVSPKESTQVAPIKRLEPISRIDANRLKNHKDEYSPKNSSPHIYDRDHNNEERPGTPTVDEPGIGANNYQYNAPPAAGPGLGHMMSMANVQCPPPNLGPTYPPGQPPMGTFAPSGPPPNFRLPPPGSVPYMPPGPYVNPPRPMYDPTRPPMTGPPPPYNAGFPPRPTHHHHHHHREFDRRGIRNHTPPGIIDDPLAAFNRMIREKDERERRAKQRMQRRTYSRSRSRSYSPRSPRRMRSRSPRRRSRSRSFSLSRSRSRSYSGSMRGGSPYRDRDRDYSPRHSPRRGPPPRFRSPVRSPPRRYKESHGPDRRDRERDHRDEYDREYRREERERDYSYREHSSSSKRERDMDRSERERERDYRVGYEGGSYEDRFNRPPKGSGQWGGHPMRAPPEAYYNPPPPEIAQNPYPAPPNRYPTARDYPPPYMNKPPEQLYQPPPPPQPTPRKYEDIAPPGVEEPPIPGLENSPRAEEKYTRNPSEPKDKEEKHQKIHKPEPEKLEKIEKLHKVEKDKEKERHRNERDSRREKDKKERERESDRKRRTHTSPTPTRKRSRSKDKESLDKRKKKREGSSDKEKSDKERKKDYSDDEKSKKTKDRKKKKEKDKKDKDKKKRDKKEKHKEKEKDKDKEQKHKHKDDFKEMEMNKPKNEDEEKSKVPETEAAVAAQTSPTKHEEIEQVISGLYDDVIQENIEKEVHEDTADKSNLINPEPPEPQEVNKLEENILDQSQYEDERGILELHTNDIDLKTELEVKNEVLAPLPEKSKWEEDDENLLQLSPRDSKIGDSKSSKPGSVSTEVLKRAENAIFAKAINAIRPIEIKKLSADRAKLYSGERDEDTTTKQVIQPVIVEKKSEKKPEPTAPPTKLSVKERLGAKVNEPDPVSVSRIDRTSPFSRRISERNYARNIDRDEKIRKDERESRVKDRKEKEIRREKDSRKDKEAPRSRNNKDKDSSHKIHHSRHQKDEKDKRHNPRNETKKTVEPEKRKRSRSKSEDHKDKRRRKDKKHSKERSKKKDENQKVEIPILPLKSATDKRKPTLDEASFVPDYDFDVEFEEKEKKEKQKGSSSDSDSSSSSDDEKKRKKRKKHKKKKSRKDSSSSSSESESESSDDDKDKKRKKHKKNKKKKKKSKHKQ